jgi:hypothetical protein
VGCSEKVVLYQVVVYQVVVYQVVVYQGGRWSLGCGAWYQRSSGIMNSH